MSNMVVATNVLALNSHRNLKGVGQKQSMASQRLSSGYRINSAADDAAGLAISEKMRAQIRGLDQASTNAQDAISLIQTAEGGMQEIDNMVQRIRELVVQASNDTNDYDTEDRQKIQDEIQQLLAEIDSMSERVEFNQKAVIDGSYEGTLVNPSDGNAYQAALNNVALAETSLASAQTALSDAINDTTNGLLAKQAALDTLIGTLLTDLVDANGNFATGLQTDLDAIQTAITSLASKIDQTGGPTRQEFDEAMQAFTDVMTGIQDVINAANNITNHEGLTALTDALTALGVSTGTGALKTLGTALGSLTGYTTPAITTLDKYGGDGTSGSTIAKNIAAANSTLVAAAAAVTVAETRVATAENAVNTKRADLTSAMTALQDASIAYNKAEREGGLYFQIGANSNQGIYVQIATVNTLAMGIGNGSEKDAGDPNIINVLQPSGDAITGLLDTLDNALSYVTTQRSKLGAVQNRLEYTINSLDISSENLSAAESRIRDTDMAKEMMNLTQANVLQQAATSMLAQANSAPQSILQLLS